MTFSVQPLAAASATVADQWRALYRAYADFYQTPMDNDTLARVWTWLQNGDLDGCYADNNGEVVGFAHWAVLLRPLHGARLLYLNDLFVAPTWRQHGIGGLLMRQVNAAAAAAACPLVRWATKADNHTARRLYDNIAQATDWIIYEQRRDG